MTVLLKAGLIATPGGRFVADLLIRDGWITAIGATGVSADRVIDATGHIVMPGWVLPFVPFDPTSTPPHQSYAGAGITCVGWPAGQPCERWCCDVAPMELIETAEQLAHAPRTIHERGCVAFVLRAGRGGQLLDAAAQALSHLRATLVIALDGEEESAVEDAERAAACGGRVVVGPLRKPRSLRRAGSAGVLAATDPGWLIDDPSLWQEVARGTIRLLMSVSEPPPGIDALYQTGPGRGLVGMEGLAALLSARPAALLGCGTKGLLVPGREADLCLLEPSAGNTMLVETLLHGSDARRPHGRRLRGEPVDGLPEI